MGANPASTAERDEELLQRLRRLAKWQGRSASKASGDTATGRGEAYVKYELYRTYVGVVATVEVVGEPATAVVPAAIANAVFDAIGVRLRSVPFTAEKVLASLKVAPAA